MAGDRRGAIVAAVLHSDSAALQGGAPLSLVAPMREMSMMMGAVLEMAILREAVSLWRLVGCVALILGEAALAGA